MAMTATADEALRRVQQARARFARDQFAECLGLVIDEVAPDRARVVLPCQLDHMNAGGVLNGGASASLLTMAATLAAWTGVDFDPSPHLGCVDLSIQYLSAVTEEDVVAEARVVRRGGGLAFVDVALRARDGRPVCHGLSIHQASSYATGRTPRSRAAHALLAAPSPLVPPAQQRLFRGYVSKFDITALHESPGRVRLTMPCTPIHVNERGQLHAGALASIVDIAAVAASWSLIPRRQGARGSTIGMQVSYPTAAAEAVVADAHVQQRSEELFYSTVHVTSVATGQLVAMGQVTYRLLEPWPDA
jgi:uncharacterized protein (TIGR00369 family)